jgi:hypothetical protein
MQQQDPEANGACHLRVVPHSREACTCSSILTSSTLCTFVSLSFHQARQEEVFRGWSGSVLRGDYSAVPPQCGQNKADGSTQGCSSRLVRHQAGGPQHLGTGGRQVSLLRHREIQQLQHPVCSMDRLFPPEMLSSVAPAA